MLIPVVIRMRSPYTVLAGVCRRLLTVSRKQHITRLLLPVFFERSDERLQLQMALERIRALHAFVISREDHEGSYGQCLECGYDGHYPCPTVVIANAALKWRSKR